MVCLDVTEGVHMSQFNQIDRPCFYPGQILTADDLRGILDYCHDKERLHNRFLHGWGIVTGLSVLIEKGTVVVSPGIALDCAGNELILPQSESISLANLEGRHYVAVRYVEVPIGNVPSPSEGTDLCLMSDKTEAKRIREEVKVELSAVNPYAGYGAHRLGDPGCGQSHALCIATIIKRDARWRVIPTKGGLLHRKRR